jgi:hypothetical protein
MHRAIIIIKAYPANKITPPVGSGLPDDENTFQKKGKPTPDVCVFVLEAIQSKEKWWVLAFA